MPRTLTLPVIDWRGCGGNGVSLGSSGAGSRAASFSSTDWALTSP